MSVLSFQNKKTHCKDKGMQQMTRWGGHSWLGKRAVEVLPEWEKELIRPDMSPENLGISCVPSPIRNGAEKLAAYCHLPDWVYEKEFRKYCFLDDGRSLPHELVDINLNPDRAAASPDGNRRLYQMLMDKMIAAIRAENWEMTVIHGGILGHILQDPLTPGHCVNNDIFFQLFKDPVPGRHLKMHALFDNATDQFEPLPPRFLGKSSGEAAYHLMNAVFKGVRSAKDCIVPVIMSAYRGEPLSSQAALLADQCRQASFITASAWHTAFCIAYGKFDETEYAALNRLKLTDILPYFWHPSPYYNEMLVGQFVENSRKKPMELIEADAHGDRKTVRISDGFGLYGYAGAKFFVDGGLYPYFRCRVGLAANVKEGIYPGRRTVFTVEVSPDENQVRSNDMEYGTKKVAEVTLRPGEPMQEITADIRGMKTLALCAKSDLTAGDGRILYAMPHVGICEPELQKYR